jgi:hypothetical protein
LHPIAAGAGTLPESIGNFSIAPPVSLTPGQRQKVWVAYKNVGIADDHVTYGLTIHVPVDGAEPLLVKLSDPADAGPRWTFNKNRPSFALAYSGFLLQGGGDTAGISVPGLSFGVPGNGPPQAGLFASLGWGFL